MTSEELKEKYWSLYEYMANSKNPENMKIFGGVMTSMVMDMIASSPSKAEEYIDRLEAVKWKQYLTTKEAEAIIDGMKPAAPWKKEVWSKAMDSLGLDKDCEPYYNCNALWVEMNKQYSDHAQTIADNILKMPLDEVPTEQLVKGMHALALDVLLDKDGKYHIRKYFGL